MSHYKCFIRNYVTDCVNLVRTSMPKSKDFQAVPFLPLSFQSVFRISISSLRNANVSSPSSAGSSHWELHMHNASLRLHASKQSAELRGQAAPRTAWAHEDLLPPCPLQPFGPTAWGRALKSFATPAAAPGGVQQVESLLHHPNH